MDFQDIRITRLEPAESELRFHTGQVKFFFVLSETPTLDWTSEFGRRWHEAGHTEKAVFAEKSLSLWWPLSDGLTCAELLKKTVASTNDWYRAELQQQEEDDLAVEAEEDAMRQQIEELAKKLKFD